MTLDEAISHVRILATGCTGVDSEAMLMLIDHASARTSRFVPDRPTLRDEFAKHGLSGLIVGGTCFETKQAAELIAATAYTVADAMLAARGK